MTLTLYVEGGGDSKKDLKVECRKGFSKFIERAGLKGRMPRIVACGGRQQAYDHFKTALGAGIRTPMLLVDAECPVTESTPWEHLRKTNGWPRPSGAGKDQCHLMVQVMESWFLADRRALRSFYGRRFHEKSLPANPRVEEVFKADVLAGLARATRDTERATTTRDRPASPSWRRSIRSKLRDRHRTQRTSWTPYVPEARREALSGDGRREPLVTDRCLSGLTPLIPRSHSPTSCSRAIPERRGYGSGRATSGGACSTRRPMPANPTSRGFIPTTGRFCSPPTTDVS